MAADEKLTLEQLKQFKADLKELNKLKKELGETTFDFPNPDLAAYTKVTELLESTKDIIDNLEGTAKGLSIQWRNILGDVFNTGGRTPPIVYPGDDIYNSDTGGGLSFGGYY